MFNVNAQKDVVNKAATLGVPAISTEHTMVIHGFEHLQFHVIGFAIPYNLAEESIKYYLAGGIEQATPQAPKIHFEHGITFLDTVSGHIIDLFDYLGFERDVKNRQTFNFDLYRGTPEKHTRKWVGQNAFLFGFDPSEYTAEDRSSLVQPQGQISYNCFGSFKGNL